MYPQVIIRHLLQLLLLIACVAAVGNAFYKWWWSVDLKYTMSYEFGQIPIPSLSICPGYARNSYGLVRPYQNQTMQDIMDNVRPFSDYLVKANLNIYNYIERYFY